MKKSDVIAILNNTESDNTEKVKAIMELHGSTVEFHKTKNGEQKTEIDELKSQLAKAPKADPDGKDWKNEYDDYKTKTDKKYSDKNAELVAKIKEFDDYKTSVESEKTISAKKQIITSELKKSGANPEYIEKMFFDIEVDKIEIDGEGENAKIKDVDKLIESVKTAGWGGLFGEIKKDGVNPANPPTTSNNQYSGKTATELMEEANKCPENMEAIFKQIETLNEPKKGVI